MYKDSTYPKVSVLISTKNRPNLIPRAVDSIMSQSFSDFELIIVDVSSDDQTREIISAYRDPRINYKRIHNEISVAKTVNNALSEARGEYLAFCDDDDEWSSIDKLKKQVALLDSLGEDYGFISCGWDVWNDSTNERYLMGLPKARGDIFSRMLISNVALGTPTLLIKKTAYFSVGGFEESIRYSTDYLLLTKLSKHYKFDFVPEIMVLGHQYHNYGSSQHLVNSSYSYRDKMECSVFFFERFKSDYEKDPLAKQSILEKILWMAANAADLISVAKYLAIYLSGKLSPRFLLKLQVRFYTSVMNRLIFQRVKIFKSSIPTGRHAE